MTYDFNILERAADRLMKQNKFQDALRIYYYMSDGDSSLDAGYLGERIGICYEALGRIEAARYWYARAVEENPEVRLHCVEALRRLDEPSLDDLL